ncbi:MAG: capsular polysaccharide synthesis protein, partial [Psychromonas sp.]
IGDYITLDTPENVLNKLLPAHQSDLLRLKLLFEYGGVWADSTTFCNTPLDEWVDAYSTSGFFAFEGPGKDRLISSWFMASEKGAPIPIKLYALMKRYWIENGFSAPNEKQIKITEKLSKILNKNTHRTKYWFNPIVTKLLGITPYFVLHYKFERLITLDEVAKDVWEKTIRISADSPHLVQRLGMLSSPTASVKQTLKDANAPLYKLTWKYEHEHYNSNTLLYRILEETES